MAPSAFFCIAALELLLVAGGTATEDSPDGQCAAAGGCSPGVLKAPANPDYWPMARGPIGSFSTSPYKGPRDLASSLKWSYDRPEGKFRAMNSNGSPLIDEKRNIYTMFGPSILKFSPDGHLLWEHFVAGFSNDIPAMLDGLLFATAFSGSVLAINRETGKQVWRSEVCAWQEKNPSTCHPECRCQVTGPDIAALAAVDGVVTFRSHEAPWGGACKVMGANATTGEFLWDYAPEHMVWNYYPMVTEDGGSFLFQDSAGGVYRLGLDGKEIWKAGMTSESFRQTWTDGGLQIGPNGVVYVMKSLGGDNVGPGQIAAYRISDGKHLWTSAEQTPEPPNAWPVIGRMRSSDPLTVIIASGVAGGHLSWWESFAQRFGSLWQSPSLVPILQTITWCAIHFTAALGDFAATQPNHIQIWGLNAETGDVLWKHIFPPWVQGKFRGENWRVAAGGSHCLPNPVGNPTLDSSGNLYIGMHDGFIYQLVRESEGPGVKVQSKYDAEGAFSSGGVSLAPGFMVIVSCDTLFAFKGEE